MNRAVAIVVIAINSVAVLAIVGISATLIVLELTKDEPKPASFCPTERGGALLESSQLDGHTEPLSPRGPRPTVLVTDGLDSSYIFGLQQVPQWRQQGNAQLVVCGYTHSPLSYGASCPDDSGRIGPIPVYQTIVTYEIYEAASRKPLGRFDLPGVQYTCPSAIIYTPGMDVRIDGEADEHQLVERLRPYVEPA